MTSDRWDPFREMVAFREAMDRWLQQSISGTGQLLSNIRPESSVKSDYFTSMKKRHLQAAADGHRKDFPGANPCRS